MRKEKDDGYERGENERVQVNRLATMMPPPGDAVMAKTQTGTSDYSTGRTGQVIPTRLESTYLASTSLDPPASPRGTTTATTTTTATMEMDTSVSTPRPKPKKLLAAGGVSPPTSCPPVHELENSNAIGKGNSKKSGTRTTLYLDEGESLVYRVGQRGISNESVQLLPLQPI
jgi:hypothetical protein